AAEAEGKLQWNICSLHPRSGAGVKESGPCHVAVSSPVECCQRQQPPDAAGRHHPSSGHLNARANIPGQLGEVMQILAQSAQSRSRKLQANAHTRLLLSAQWVRCERDPTG